MRAYAGSCIHRNVTGRLGAFLGLFPISRSDFGDFMFWGVAACASSDCISPERAGIGPAPVAHCVAASSPVSLES